MRIQDGIEKLDDKLLLEAAEPKRLSAKGAVAVIFAAVLLIAAIPTAALNTDSALLSGVEKQAQHVLKAVDTLDDYESEGYETASLTSVALTAEDNHETPVADALMDYSERLQALKERATNSLTEFKDAADDFGRDNVKLTATQRRSLRQAKRWMKQNLSRVKKARAAISAKEIAMARKSGDTERLNEIYSEVCTALEIGCAKLSFALDKLDSVTKKLAGEADSSHAASSEGPGLDTGEVPRQTDIDDLSLPYGAELSKESVAATVERFNAELTEKCSHRKISEEDFGAV